MSKVTWLDVNMGRLILDPIPLTPCQGSSDFNAQQNHQDSLGSIPRMVDSAALGQGPRICISNKFLGAMVVAGLGATLCKPTLNSRLSSPERRVRLREL